MLQKFFGKIKKTTGLDITDLPYLFGGLIAYSGITLATITKFSVWFDEAFGFYLIRHNFFEVYKYTASDIHPPFYYWLLKIWSMIFGSSELALRSMSVFLGLIAIFIGYLLVSRLFNKKAARLSLLFMIISPMFVRYGQEGRMYTLIALIALLATYVLTFAINSKKKLPWAIYGVLVGLGLLTHYFTAVIWVCHWLWKANIIRQVSEKGN